MTSNFEHGEGQPTKELLFSSLEIGDTVILKTASGSAYRLLISDARNNPLATLERSSDHKLRGDASTKWEELNEASLFELRGSCKNIMIGDTGSAMPQYPTPGFFRVGERAWLGIEVEGQDTTLVTSRVQEIETIKPDLAAA
jgi:hypothetical protein